MSQANVDFYTLTSEAWRAMLADIRVATSSIFIEQYIFAIDEIGKDFIEALRQKRKDGLEVKILCDMVGSYGFYNSYLPDFLRSEGIEVRFFNPIKPWRIANFTSGFFRDHRKILVIDNEIAHLGGVGIGDSMADWRDTHMRITGAIVGDILESFLVVWKSVKGAMRIRYPKTKAVAAEYNFLTNAPVRQRYIYKALLSAIRNARNYIYLSTPYFIPSVPLYRALRRAARRGVDVRIVVPEISDVIFSNASRESYFTLLLRAGIKIYTYVPEMMHAKTAVIDDKWATAGSFNLDSLSFFFNHEANIASSDPAFVSEIKQDFVEDLSVCRRVVYEEWIKRSLYRKFLELLTWPFHTIL